MIFTYRVNTKHSKPELREDVLTYDTASGELLGENPERLITTRKGLVASSFIAEVLGYEVLETEEHHDGVALPLVGWVSTQDRWPDKGQRIRGRSPYHGEWGETFNPDNARGYMTHWRPAAGVPASSDGALTRQCCSGYVPVGRACKNCGTVATLASGCVPDCVLPSQPTSQGGNDA